MERGKKLASLLKSREADEHQALQERMRIDKIVAERRRALDEVEAQCRTLSKRILSAEGGDRREALQSGDARRVGLLTDFSETLRKKLEQLRKAASQKREEVERARARAALAEEELVKARVERKKVETLIAGQERSQRLVDAALDESLQDEMTSHLHTK